MTIDGLTLFACVKELKDTIIGAKVEKVFQPLKEEIGLALHTADGTKRLLISLNAGECRMHFTESPKANPAKPPTFCMLLRKYLTMSRITSIEQIGLERIVKIAFDGKDDLGLARNLTLICEFMGKYSNVILTDENEKILGAAKHVPFGVSSVRQILPGMSYETPPSDKYNPMLVSADTFFELAENIGNKPMDKFLVHTFQGVSSQTAHELTTRYLSAPYSGLSRGDKHRFIGDCLAFFKTAMDGNYEFTIQFDTDKTPVFFSVVPYQTKSSASKQTFDSANAMLDSFYLTKHHIEIIKRKKAALNKTLKKALDKLAKKLRIQNDALLGAEKAEAYKHFGDLITANIYQLKRGMDKAVLEDYENEKTVEIALDKTLTPAANAQKYYKRYNKMKKSAALNAKSIIGTKTEIDFLESTSASLDTCETLEELGEVRFDLVRHGYISEKPGTKTAKPTNEASAPNKFVSSDGFTILAGKNNRQNDTLTMRTADPDDIWMHTQKIPGSHIIIKTDGKDIPDQTLFEAAMIAAINSRAGTSTKVPVDYTLRKHVKKPSGAKPGYVIYDNFSTLIVDPDERLIDKLKNNG